MSENLNRSNPDFSKYDSMSIGELEVILRADAQGPERDDSDVDEILYVMEVLAKKRRQNGIAGKTTLEAYQEFQQHYLPAVEEKHVDSVPKHKSTAIPFHRIASIAASLVLIFTLTTSVNAFGWKDIWNAVAKWAEETFSFSTGVEVSEPKPEDELEYESLQELLQTNNISTNIAPTYLPDNYVLIDLFITESPVRDEYLAVYSDNSHTLRVSIKSYINTHPEQLVVNDNICEIYTQNGIDYYILSNNGALQAVWINGSFECYISGMVSVDQIKAMIDSIRE